MGMFTEEGLLMHTGIYTRNQTWKVGSHGLGILLESEWDASYTCVCIPNMGMFLKLHMDLFVGIGTGERG